MLGNLILGIGVDAIASKAVKALVPKGAGLVRRAATHLVVDGAGLVLMQSIGDAVHRELKEIEEDLYDACGLEFVDEE